MTEREDIFTNSAILGIAASIATQRELDVDLSGDRSKIALLRQLRSDEELGNSFFEALFDPSSKTVEEQLSSLSRFQYNVGIEENGCKLVAWCWEKLLSQENSKDYLMGLLVGNGSTVFLFLDPLALAFRNVLVSEDVIRVWLCSARTMLNNDMAVGQIYKVVDSIHESNANALLKVLEGIDPLQDVGSREMFSGILGRMRSGVREGANKETLEQIREIDQQVSNSDSEEIRSAYISSFSECAWRGTLTLQDCEGLYEGSKDKSLMLREVAIWVLSIALRSPKSNAEILTYAKITLSAHAKTDASIMEKNAIVEASKHLFDAEQEIHDDWIAGVMPVPSKCDWTWMLVESYLKKRLNAEGDLPTGLIIRVAESGGAEWLEYLGRRSDKSLLFRALDAEARRLIATHLLVSKKRDARRLGFSFFKAVENDLLNREVVEGWSDDELTLAICELRREHLEGNVAARYLISMLPGIDKRTSLLRAELAYELEVQCRNYGGSCFDYFKEHTEDSPMIAEVVAKMEKYFEVLKDNRNSPAKHMEVPGLTHAKKLHFRKFGRGVVEEMEKHSIFRFLSNRPAYSLTYGESWRIRGEDGLNQGSQLHPASTTFEMPTWEFVEPELSALRRLNASVSIKNLCKEGDVNG